VGCSTLELTAGEHELRPAEGWTLDQLDLYDQLVGQPAAGAGRDLVTDVEGRDVDQVITVAASDGPVALRIGQSWDPRWRATVGGKDLGPPMKVDGWSSGWLLPPASGSRSVHVQFAPQRGARLALAASITTVLVAAGLWLWGFRRRRSHVDATVGTAREVRPARTRAVPYPAFSVLAAGAAGVSLGMAGLVGVVVALLLSRVRALPTSAKVATGAGLVAFAGLIQVMSASDSWGSVDATVPSATMWPHWLAVVGLVVALSAGLATDSSVRSVREPSVSPSSLVHGYGHQDVDAVSGPGEPGRRHAPVRDVDWSMDAERERERDG
jgi:arabinofuranan 3-O-arabinosyltransferase